MAQFRCGGVALARARRKIVLTGLRMAGGANKSGQGRIAVENAGQIGPGKSDPDCAALLLWLFRVPQIGLPHWLAIFDTLRQRAAWIGLSKLPRRSAFLAGLATLRKSPTTLGLRDRGHQSNSRATESMPPYTPASIASSAPRKIVATKRTGMCGS